MPFSLTTPTSNSHSDLMLFKQNRNNLHSSWTHLKRTAPKIEMETQPLNTTTTYLRYLLTAQLLLGGQTRLTSLITPGAHAIAMSKASQLQHYVPLPFISDPKRHSQAMGALMLGSGVMLCAKSTRLPGALIAGGVLLSWVYGFGRMGAEWYVPLVNCGIVGLMVWGEVR